MLKNLDGVTCATKGNRIRPKMCILVGRRVHQWSYNHVKISCKSKISGKGGIIYEK